MTVRNNTRRRRRHPIVLPDFESCIGCANSGRRTPGQQWLLADDRILAGMWCESCATALALSPNPPTLPTWQQ